jgi:hypothetical protein
LNLGGSIVDAIALVPELVLPAGGENLIKRANIGSALIMFCDRSSGLERGSSSHPSLARHGELGLERCGCQVREDVVVLVLVFAEGEENTKRSTTTTEFGSLENSNRKKKPPVKSARVRRCYTIHHASLFLALRKLRQTRPKRAFSAHRQ